MSEQRQSRELNPFKQILVSPAMRAFLALLLVLAVGAVFNADGAFFKISTHRDTLRQASVYGILACGMTLVIISGGIDLSVGSALALAAVCCATLCIHWNWSGWLAVPVCLLVGAVVGCVAGFTTARLRVQPFIATLAMMVLARGLAPVRGSRCGCQDVGLRRFGHVCRSRRRLPGRSGTAGGSRSGKRLRIDRHRHGRDRRNQFDGWTRWNGSDGARRADHRLPQQNPQHQCRPGSRAIGVDGHYHCCRGIDPAAKPGVNHNRIRIEI